MRMMTLLMVSGVLLLTMATPVNAHEAGHHEYVQKDRYQHSNRRRSQMPRWLKRQKDFRYWYRHSRYQRRRAPGWARLFEIYEWERRYARRYDDRRHYDHYYDQRRVDRMRRNRDW